MKTLPSRNDPSLLKKRDLHVPKDWKAALRKNPDMSKANQLETRRQHQLYRRAMETLNKAGLDFIVGGAYALYYHSGIRRDTKDLDIFIRPKDLNGVLDALERAGFNTELTFHHWLGKALSKNPKSNSEIVVDIIFSSGNGVCVVDEEWFRRASIKEVAGMKARISPAEEMIWSKSFILERNRFDGADVLHILRARAEFLDWERLLRRFGSYWHLLLAHILLFRFVYPSERDRVPDSVLQKLLERLDEERRETPPKERLCRGTLFSYSQYQPDIESWDYRDARLAPWGPMTREEIEQWQAAFRIVPKKSGKSQN